MRSYAQLVSDVFSRYPDPEEQESLADKEIELRCLYTDFADDVREELPEGATPWSLILDRPEDEEMAELQKMAMVLDAFMRTDSFGFGNVHLVLVNDPDSDDVSWERTDDGYMIHLCAESGWHWCQVAYQMAVTPTRRIGKNSKHFSAHSLRKLGTQSYRCQRRT